MERGKPRGPSWSLNASLASSQAVPSETASPHPKSPPASPSASVPTRKSQPDPASPERHASHGLEGDTPPLHLLARTQLHVSSRACHAMGFVMRLGNALGHCDHFRRRAIDWGHGNGNPGKLGKTQHSRDVHPNPLRVSSGIVPSGSWVSHTEPSRSCLHLQ
jgi:hypothetical protein